MKWKWKRKRSKQKYDLKSRFSKDEPAEYRGFSGHWNYSVWFYNVLLFSQSCLTLWPHGLQHARLPSPSVSRGSCSILCPLSQWWHSTISASVVPFFCPQSFPASPSFPMSWLYTSGGQSVDIYLYNSINAETYLYLSKLMKCATPREY